MVEENEGLAKSNAAYRQLILDNETQLEKLSQEIQDYVKHLGLKNK